MKYNIKSPQLTLWLCLPDLCTIWIYDHLSFDFITYVTYTYDESRWMAVNKYQALLDCLVVRGVYMAIRYTGRFLSAYSAYS